MSSFMCFYNSLSGKFKSSWNPVIHTCYKVVDLMSIDCGCLIHLIILPFVHCVQSNVEEWMKGDKRGCISECVCVCVLVWCFSYFRVSFVTVQCISVLDPD